MATYDYATAGFPSSPATGDFLVIGDVTYIYSAKGAWVVDSTSGGWTEIATQTISTSVQTVTFSSLSLSAYSVVRLLISDVVHNNNQYTFLKLSNDGFTTNETWDSNVTVSFDNTTSSYDRQSNGTRNGSTGEKLILTPHAVWANPIKLNGWIDFIVNDTCLLINGLGVVKDDGLAAVQWSGFIDITTFTDLKLEKYTGGTFNSGTYKLLGMA